MDTPAIPAPKDAREQEILEQAEAIRDQLLLLKQDRTKYIRTQDVMILYDQVIEQVRQLNEARTQGGDKAENRRKFLRPSCVQCEVLTANRIVDKVLESCFQLLSLFFMTIGRTSEAPAAYALTSTIKRLLDHLTEAGLYSAKDLESMSTTLDRLTYTVKNDSSKHSPYLVELLEHRVQLCKASLANLQKKLDSLEDLLRSIHGKLISILRSTALANTRTRVRAPRLAP
jgi:hypothetical protein